MRTKVISRVRKAVVTAAAAVSLLAPALRAQQEVQAAQPSSQPAADAQAPSEVRGQLATPAPDGETQIYTIHKGDTLWDLSQKFLASPWYWPKIWSLNSYIENPHWIYPGNKIKVTPGKGGAPAQVELQDGLPRAAEGAEASDDAAPIPKSDEAVDFAVRSGGPKETAAARRSVSVAGRLSFVPPTALSVRASGLVTPDELRGAGLIDASFEEKQMLATYDQAYIRFQNDVPAAVGDKLLIFRPDEGTVTDPVTHRKLAERTKTVGEVTVLAVDGKSATVQVGRVWDEIERGDRVRPWTEQSKRIAPRPNRTALDGVIISGVNPTLTTFGEANEVFINKGSADGVEEGNTFTVVRKGDGLGSTGAGFASYTGGAAGASAQKVSLPDEVVGMLIVVDVKDRVSTAVVVKSIRELEAGERVAMRSATGPGNN
ncbi:MAG: LysM domain-containing protein [Myxococcales bacterium]